MLVCCGGSYCWRLFFIQQPFTLPLNLFQKKLIGLILFAKLKHLLQTFCCNFTKTSYLEDVANWVIWYLLTCSFKLCRFKMWRFYTFLYNLLAQNEMCGDIWCGKQCLVFSVSLAYLGFLCRNFPCRLPLKNV